MIEIATALIAAVAVVGAAVVGIWGKRLDTRIEKFDHVLERVRGQVENSHDTNLRDELDARHKETRRWFDGIRTDVNETRLDLGGIRSELRLLRSRDDGLDERVQDVEKDVKQILKEKP